jgi:hypothetical protein
VSGSALEDLRAEIARAQAVVIAGAGAAIAASGGARAASWVGLLKAGLEHCDQLPGIEEKWSKAARLLLEVGDIASLLSVRR